MNRFFLPGRSGLISTAFHSGQRRGVSCAKMRIQTWVINP
nr:MAG TPA: hypothetical protein [Caudoviricetes sp.]